MVMHQNQVFDSLTLRTTLIPDGEFDAVSNNRPTQIKAPKPLLKYQYFIILITICSSFLILKKKEKKAPVPVFLF
jgi:hypothetical protein